MTDTNSTFTLPHPGAWIYLMGICGTGMAALAGLLKEKGYRVSGSDSAAYPPMSQVLEDLDIPVHIGYSTRNLEKLPEPFKTGGHAVSSAYPALVIIGNVIRADNPEARFVLSAGLPYMSFPEAISHFFLEGRVPLVISGTHGKTTTSTLTVSALKACGQEPGFMIGGILQQFGSGFHLGTPPWFVLEGDEYDTAFFDKGPKFLHYKPHAAIITSIEFDHADIFKDLNEIKSAFTRLVNLIPEDGLLVACGDWPTVREVTASARCRVVFYGEGPDNRWRLEDLVIGPGTTCFDVHDGNGNVTRVCLGIPGRHNALNALAALALLTELGMDKLEAIAGLEACPGVKRRQEVRGKRGGITVIDDFAHHPRAVRETLSALRATYPDGKLIAVFEPRTNTSRRSVFQGVYPTSFDSADLVLVRAVPDPDKAPEGDRFSSEMLVADLKKRGIPAKFFQDAGQIVEYLVDVARHGDTIVILSNGDFEGLHERLLASLPDDSQ